MILALIAVHLILVLDIDVNLFLGELSHHILAVLSLFVVLLLLWNCVLSMLVKLLLLLLLADLLLHSKVFILLTYLVLDCLLDSLDLVLDILVIQFYRVNHHWLLTTWIERSILLPLVAFGVDCETHRADVIFFLTWLVLSILIRVASRVVIEFKRLTTSLELVLLFPLLRSEHVLSCNLALGQPLLFNDHLLHGLLLLHLRLSQLLGLRNASLEYGVLPFFFFSCSSQPFEYLLFLLVLSLLGAEHLGLIPLQVGLAYRATLLSLKCFIFSVYLRGKSALFSVLLKFVIFLGFVLAIYLSDPPLIKLIMMSWLHLICVFLVA